MTKEITVRPFGGGNVEYVVDLDSGKVWVLKGRSHSREKYRSTITSARKIRQMIKLAQAQIATPVAPVADDCHLSDDPSRLEAARLVRIFDKIYSVHLSSGDSSIVSVQCRMQNKRKVINQVLNRDEAAWRRAVLIARLAKANDAHIGQLMIDGQIVYYESVAIS
jgi:hypothetical protein